MGAKYKSYDRVSQVRMLRSLVGGLLLCIMVLLYAVYLTGEQMELMRSQIDDMAVVVQRMAE